MFEFGVIDRSPLLFYQFNVTKIGNVIILNKNFLTYFLYVNIIRIKFGNKIIFKNNKANIYIYI